MLGTNYNAEMSQPPYECVYLEASCHYAPSERVNMASTAPKK